MAFLNPDRKYYLKQTLVPITNEDRIVTESSDNFTFTVNLDRAIPQVVSIELAYFSVPRLITPSFVGAADLYQIIRDGKIVLSNTVRNTETDVRLTAIDGIETLEFTSSMDTALILISFITLTGITVSEFLLLQYLYFDFVGKWSLKASATPGTTITPTNYRLSFTGLTDPVLEFFLQHKASSVYGTVELLYGTGPSRADQSSAVLGFKPNVDTTPTADRNSARADYVINTRPYTYVDVNLEEAAELRPLARIFTVDESSDAYATQENPVRRPRLLANPVPLLDQLNVTLRLPGGLRPSYVCGIGMDLVFSVLSLAEETRIPEWLKQTIGY